MRLSFIAWLIFAGSALAEDQFEQPPIEYSAATPHNPVADLQASLEQKQTRLKYDERLGYLPDLLAQLKIAPESQLLVFSKTSLQRQRITPRTPRALYFNDDVYIGYCHAGEVLEISAADPQLGTVFYTLDQDDNDAPRIVRQTERCLQCHGTSQTDYVPGHSVRSLFVDASGLPLLGEGTKRVDHTTPLEDRWGGWYVSGTHGEQTHLGNLIIRHRDDPKPWRNDRGHNVTDLRERFDAEEYLTPHSDLVALMIFEHQTHLHNLLTRANFTARQALHYEASFNKALGEPADKRLDSTTRRIDAAAEKLVQGLLFVEEAPLKAPLAGTSGFAEKFTAAGKKDSRGRSLRDLDLKSRLFRYPCSYLVDSPSFAGLPPLMKTTVLDKLRMVLDGKGGDNYKHLSPADLVAIREILAETAPELTL